MGRIFESKIVADEQQLLPFTVVKKYHRESHSYYAAVRVERRGEMATILPQEISAIILRRVKGKSKKERNNDTLSLFEKNA